MELLAESQDWFCRERLASESLRYAADAQISDRSFVEKCPTAAVISVIRDFPASMGLIDYHNHPKTDPQEWSFQRYHAPFGDAGRPKELRQERICNCGFILPTVVLILSAGI